jgi:hypothetical protein
MHCSNARSVLPTFAAIVAVALSAGSAAADAAPAAMTTPQIRDQFLSCGYAVDDDVRGAQLDVRDPGSASHNPRVLTVVVYPDAQSAAAAQPAVGVVLYNVELIESTPRGLNASEITQRVDPDFVECLAQLRAVQALAADTADAPDAPAANYLHQTLSGAA